MQASSVQAAPENSPTHVASGFPVVAVVAAIQAYRLFLRPVLGNRCRYWPTCSEYALQAVRDHGAAKGGWLSARRLMRCHPFCPGGYDPVPSRPGVRSPSRTS